MKNPVHVTGFFLPVTTIAVNNYKTAIDIPISELEFKNYPRISAFKKWMQQQTETQFSDNRYLLLWYKLNQPSPAYEDFFELAAVAAKYGYHTAIDVFQAKKNTQHGSLAKLIWQIYGG